MKQYKVEGLIFYSKVTGGKNHIIDASAEEIQQKLDEYAEDGWSLVSTNSTGFGAAIYVYLYFEKDSMFEVRSLE